MKDVRAPGVIKPAIVKLAPYITTKITDNVDAAFRPPKKSPTTFCCNQKMRLLAAFGWGRGRGENEIGIK